MNLERDTPWQRAIRRMDAAAAAEITRIKRLAESKPANAAENDLETHRVEVATTKSVLT